MTARELSEWEFTCDRCGHLEIGRDGRAPSGWERRRGIDFCPGCAVDLLRFLTNRTATKQLRGDEYRYPDPAERDALRAELAAKGVGW